jgi:hypothetical protein
VAENNESSIDNNPETIPQGESAAALRDRIAELEAANAALRGKAGRAPAVTETKRQRGWGWTLLATVLIVIGAILAPIAVVASWASHELTDTDTFVATFAPLAKDPAVQDYVTTQTVDVIEQKVNFSDLTSNVIDGITELGTGPRATAALNALKGPAAAGLRTLTTNAVSNFVKSKSFATIWEQTLRVSHSQLLATLNGDSGAVVAVNSKGEIGVQLGPIVAQVKKTLVKQGLTFASAIPAVNRTIVIAQSDAVPTIQSAYRFAVALGVWLPWISLLFLAAGVLVARRRALALVWAAIALALSMAILGVGFGVAGYLFLSALPANAFPKDAASVIFNDLVQAMRDTTLSVALLAVVVAIIAWLSGPFRAPFRLRGFAAAGFASVRSRAEAFGIGTGKAGAWIYRQRLLIRVLIALVAGVVVLFVRPLSAGLIIWTLVLAVIAIVILELVQRPPAEDSELPPEGEADLRQTESARENAQS